MFKRKADSDIGMDSKRQDINEKGSDCEQKVSPIPRNLRLQTVTLHFCQRSWEEIGPGELYYLPICQNPRYMFDRAMFKQFEKFVNFGGFFEIHTPTVKLSNLIMLQDDLKVQSNTPTDTTAFTQVVYMMQYTPTRQSEYFKLQSLVDEKTFSATDLTYNMETPKTINRRYLIKMNNYVDFEKLIICPAKVNAYAGFDLNSPVSFDQETFELLSPYISPRDGSFSTLSGNLEINGPDNFITNGNHVTFAKNLDKITMHKYGDIVELPIITNLENKKLFLNDENNFLVNVNILRNPNPSLLTTFKTEWSYPSPNRPYFSRDSNYDNVTTPGTNVKSLKYLKHHFLTMPPIKKPNGALLAQRCSFMMEQCMSITFYDTESIWESETEDNMLFQKSGIKLRRNIYGKPEVKRGNFGKISTTPYLQVDNAYPTFASKNVSVFFM